MLSVAQSKGSLAVAAFTGNWEFWSQLRPELARPFPFPGLSFPIYNMRGRMVEMTTEASCHRSGSAVPSRFQKDAFILTCGWLVISELDSHSCLEVPPLSPASARAGTQGEDLPQENRPLGPCNQPHTLATAEASPLCCQQS